MSTPYTGGSRPGAPQARTASWVNLVLGAWLIISGFVFAYEGVLWNNVVVGIAVLVFAWIRVGNPRHNVWLSWINVALGVWTFISAFALRYSSDRGAMWNNVIVGLLVVIFGIWSALSTHPSTTT